MEGLPEGWIQASLGEVFDLNPARIPVGSLPTDAQVTFVPMAALDAATGTILAPETRRLASVVKGYTSFREGDVIVAKITPCFENGKAAIARGLANGIGFGSTEFHVFRPLGGVLADYLHLYVRQRSFRDAAAQEMTGTVGQKRVPAAYLREAVLPIPPLAEQRRLVAAIEVLLHGVDMARARLTRVPTMLKRFRRAILAAACSGRLTQDWREAHAQPAVASPPNEVGEDESDNTDAFAPELPSTWAWVALDDACEAVIDYRGRTPPTSERGRIPHIRTTNIREGRIDWNTESFVTEETYREYMTRGIPKPGDVIFTMEAPLGEAAPIEVDSKFSLAQRLLLLRPKHGLLNEHYLASLLQAGPIRRAVEVRATGSTVQGIAYKRLKYVRLPIPPLLEQAEIVRRLKSLISLADSIAQRVALSTDRAARLKQAVLERAFRGELIPTEAELARKELRDFEPASVLLERIRMGNTRSGDRAGAPARRRNARRLA